MLYPTELVAYGTDGQTRTDTLEGLNLLPLPLGYICKATSGEVFRPQIQRSNIKWVFNQNPNWDTFKVASHEDIFAELKEGLLPVQ